jgi:hypothetical protein
VAAAPTIPVVFHFAIAIAVAFERHFFSFRVLPIRGLDSASGGVSVAVLPVPEPGLLACRLLLVGDDACGAGTTSGSRLGTEWELGCMRSTKQRKLATGHVF